ncbi:MAG: FAD-dependent oxidoreductase [Candidatus Brocadiia bacterium]
MTETWREPARDVPIIGNYDIVVCGGGPAGCAAAISSARNGAETLLVEKESYLGGATVAQLVCVVLSTNGVDFQGIWHEYARRLRRRNGMRDLIRKGCGQIRSCVDPEIVKFVWDDLCSEAGVNLLHHAWACDAIIEDEVASGVVLETKAGRRVVRAERLVDATGDAVVAAAAGVPWEQGDGLHPWAMALTKVFRMGNVEKPENWPDEDALEELESELDAAIKRGEYDAPVVTEKNRLLNYLRGWMWELPEQRREILSVISRVLKVDPLDPFDLTRAEREGREQARQAADFLRRHAPGFEDSYLLDTSNHIGLRSSRRIVGEAIVTKDDAWDFRKCSDSIARSSWNIDVWPADSYSRPAVPHHESAYQERTRKMVEDGEYFDIPFGALLPKNLDNLLVAGRCISAGHEAEASLRIQQTCMATGQAAGTATALSLAENVSPKELDVQALQDQLEIDRDVEPAFELLAELPLASR